MNKSTYFLISLMVLLGGAYLYFFSDFFAPKIIQIVPQSRPNKKSKLNPDVYLTSFMLDGSYRLTEIKVFNADESKTNKYSKPIWHMVAESNSAPTKVVHYGIPLPGMKPYVLKSRPAPLYPDVNYKVELYAGKFKGEKAFQARPVEE